MPDILGLCYGCPANEYDRLLVVWDTLRGALCLQVLEIFVQVRHNHNFYDCPPEDLLPGICNNPERVLKVVALMEMLKMSEESDNRCFYIPAHKRATTTHGPYVRLVGPTGDRRWVHRGTDRVITLSVKQGEVLFGTRPYGGGSILLATTVTTEVINRTQPG